MRRIMGHLPTRKVERVAVTKVPISRIEFGQWLERKMQSGVASVGDPRNPASCPLHNFEQEEYGADVHFYYEGARRVVAGEYDLAKIPVDRIPIWAYHFQHYAMAEGDRPGGISPQQAIYCLNKS